LAALTGEGVYNLTAITELTATLSPLAAHPEHAWLLEILHAVAAGDIPLFRQLSQHQYTARIPSQPALAHGAAMVQEKLTPTSLVLAVLQVHSHDHCLAFADIQRLLYLDSIDQVEWVLMRACSVNLIQGRMDQCDQTIDITWVQPRHLTPPQMGPFGAKIRRVGRQGPPNRNHGPRSNLRRALGVNKQTNHTHPNQTSQHACRHLKI
jgi:26S proteasome regulatory subunit N9